MNKVKIKCFICDVLDNYRYKVIIYDLNKNIIINTYTDNNGNLKNSDIDDGVYIIVIIPCIKLIPNIRVKKVYISKKYNDFCFNFYKNTYPITIRLIDQNYRGLTINKGEVKLWQNLM